jgi:hypothetical protein
VASGANFDAEIRLDIGPFIASIKRAQGEVAKLSQQIDSLNKKTVAPRVAVAGGSAQLGTASTSVGAGSQQRMAAAKEEIAVQNNLIKAENARGKNASRSANEMERNLARERYALYDVAATYTILAAAASGTILAMSKSAIDYERTFANVARTTEFNSIKAGQAVENMKYELKALASEIPVAFSQITEIATIGNQLGIAQGALTSFTETVAKFSATTGVSVQSTAMSFGRIGELLTVTPENFEKLGSAIAFAGVNAVATEEQILSVTKEIATTAKMAKFTA